MKRLILLLSITLVLIFNSCTSDDNKEQNTIAGEIIINGKTFGLTEGFIIPNYTGTDSNFDPRSFYVVLANGSVNLDNNEFVYSNSITQLVDFNLQSSLQSSGSIENATYPISDFGNPNFDSDKAYLYHSGVNSNVVIQNGKYVSSASLSTDDLKGEATFLEKNGIYKITFSYTNAQNIVSGTFSGKLSDLNYKY